MEYTKKPKSCNQKFTLVLLFSSIFLLIQFPLLSQNELTKELLGKHTIRFQINDQFEMDEEVSKFFIGELIEHQFVGLAELHQSQQLSYFTTGLLTLLRESGYNHFALEIGPFSADYLQKNSLIPSQSRKNIKKLNNKYGSRILGMTPLIFADRVEDALFISKAAELGFTFWGLDQEFIYSYEMHLDSLYAMFENPTSIQNKIYRKCKSRIRKWSRKSAWWNQFKFNCKLKDDPAIAQFFSFFNGNKKAEEIMTALTISWEIYCKNEQGAFSNQQRADYMKFNFDKKYKNLVQQSEAHKVFVKLGSVHLTKGISPFGVDDMGKHLQDLAVKDSTAFLSIRHLARFRKGKDLLTNSDWTDVYALIQIGEKDTWTLVDLRPIRKLIKNGEVKTDTNTKFEIDSYDLLLIPPNDRKSKPNF